MEVTAFFQKMRLLSIKCVQSALGGGGAGDPHLQRTTPTASEDITVSTVVSTGQTVSGWLAIYKAERKKRRGRNIYAHTPCPRGAIIRTSMVLMYGVLTLRAVLDVSCGLIVWRKS